MKARNLTGGEIMEGPLDAGQSETISALTVMVSYISVGCRQK